MGESNVRAFLRVIREGESDQTDAAYTVINGGSHFTAPPWRHPWHGIPTTQGAKACGAYQFLGTTWARVADVLGFGEDFSPINQDLGAVYLIAGRGAIADVTAGHLGNACRKLAQEWVSLPNLSLDRIQRVFVEYGGQIDPNDYRDSYPIGPADAPEPPTTHAPEAPSIPASPKPPKEPTMGIGLILGLVQSVLSAMSGNAQVQLAPILSQLGAVAPGTTPESGSKDEMILKFATDMMGMVLQAAGVNPKQATDTQKVQATMAVISDPVKLKSVEDKALARLEKVTPLFDKLTAIDKQTADLAMAGRDAAAQRGLIDRWDMTKTIVTSSEGLAYLAIMLGSGLIAWALYRDKWEVALSILAVVASWVTSTLKSRGQIFDYRFDGTPQSNASNAINAELARKPAAE